jgi:hypothetical protein
MAYVVKSIEEYAQAKATGESKKRYQILGKNGEYIVLHWTGLLDPIVYDASFDEAFRKVNWFWDSKGTKYACAYSPTRRFMYMHSEVLCNNEEGKSVDHINRIKTDNRTANLRIATQSQQNSNRHTRSDKKPPCEELQKAGVHELPRFVRWDNSEGKFIIEKHPRLIQDVAEGKRKKPLLSGSKSVKLTVVEKFQDILAKLDALSCDFKDKEAYDNFEKERKRLEQEYYDICAPIYEYLGMTPKQPRSENCPVEAIQHTTEGRKKQDSGLPPDCGVTIDMLPKGTYYTPASEKRGDKFTLERHPITGERCCKNTTSSKKVNTKDKFKHLMEMYNIALTEEKPSCKIATS